jgi:2-polyprenyl-6-methoxyphenol hydroxylase-like FAD-dependent oxidoreductase
MGIHRSALSNLLYAALLADVIQTRCCIAGGGPAGMMLGFLLARAGVDVCVLEKHADFLRDFRGDTIHPSTLELMHELGLLNEFLKRPHQEVRELSAHVGGEQVPIADFTHLPTHCRFLVFMPQWDFLDFLADHARLYSSFHLKTQTEVTELIEEQGVVVGVRARTPEGALEVRAALTVGADGRHSVVRQRAGLEVIHLGAPMDVMWMRISRRPSDPRETFGRVDRGRFLAMLNREDYWQCAYVIPKGSADELRQRGLAAFRQEIASLLPFLAEEAASRHGAGRLEEDLRDWKQVSLLTVAVDRLAKWHRAGLLCLGDAAHAMSPIGGVGINLAIQDAVATANILAEILRRRAPTDSELHAVQKRRTFPTRATQRMQLVIQNRVIQRILGNPKPITPPWPLKLLRHSRVLRRIPARVIGVGFRPEHVKSARVSVMSRDS